MPLFAEDFSQDTQTFYAFFRNWKGLIVVILYIFIFCTEIRAMRKSVELFFYTVFFLFRFVIHRIESIIFIYPTEIGNEELC